MRKHPLLAFATATSMLSLTLAGSAAGATAALSGHRAARQTLTVPAEEPVIATLTASITPDPVATLRHARRLRAERRAARKRRELERLAAEKAATVHHVRLLGGVWADLRNCESGGNYQEDTGNGYFGAYQFALATWRSLGGSGLPSQASPAQQDAMAVRLQQRSGWSAWPDCSWSLGLE